MSEWSLQGRILDLICIHFDEGVPVTSWTVSFPCICIDWIPSGNTVIRLVLLTACQKKSLEQVNTTMGHSHTWARG